MKIEGIMLQINLVYTNTKSESICYALLKKSGVPKDIIVLTMSCPCDTTRLTEETVTAVQEVPKCSFTVKSCPIITSCAQEMNWHPPTKWGVQRAWTTQGFTTLQGAGHSKARAGTLDKT